ncbi:helix-turn-helix domain-containing protein [Halalkalicoccus sp. NIPERK01]|uniref:helix-turn-helix domain-containing protein n=1 Tax=Halalkalicoccus sp. NIPERK01 TaxID=3053469 RepID=UPI00256F44D0|nr:helix-turn-helix domain-containing protein [Halalkalicoccus sp. NIPERK01]MDL5361152.1 helix-turn-helix domain-containing protein [Halalkalicoccus sp. NIPERK01]
MSVLVTLEIGTGDFELGRVFSTLDDATTIELEPRVPLPGATIPVVWLENGDHDALEDHIGAHPTVATVEKLERLEERSLYALEWALEYDHLFRYFRDEGVHVLAASGSVERWRFTLRFGTHKALSAFQDYCTSVPIDIEVLSVYNTPEQESDSAFGITQPQREALTLAVREGYYDLPRGCSTDDLAEQLGISDQAVTERLRRAIATLTRNTVMSTTR